MSAQTRRNVLKLAAAAVAGAGVLRSGLLPAAAYESTIGTHGLSAFGDLKYASDFPHFDYVDPAAPKGGIFSQIAGAGTATFNSLNAYILKGDPAIDVELTFASLMARAFDEPDAVYCLAAERVAVSTDGLTYRYTLRRGLRFHDGSPLTAQDVVFSLNILAEKGHPNITVMLRDLQEVEAVGDRVVVLRFSAKRGRDAPLFAATLPIFSRAYYSTRNFAETTLEPPLGSGPYKIGRFEQGRFMEFDRVKDWWGADLPVARGMHNFDVIRYDYFRDRDVAFEGFTARTYAFREEYTSRIWATRYDFAGIKDGRVRRETLPDDRPSGAQGWMINTRHEKFRDPRVREALALAFDFEWTNKNIMFGSYDRTHSYFQNSDMMAKGKPSPEELALLEPFRGKVPEEVFGEPWVPPVSDGSGQDRKLLRRAGELLTAAGWSVKDGKRINAKGEKLDDRVPVLRALVRAASRDLRQESCDACGVDASLRIVEPVQYRARVEDFDFDITVQRMVFPVTPGDTLRTYFQSQAAKTKGTYNFPGISDPVVDALVEQVITANSRPALVNACRALDRVLRAGRYWVPHWYKGSHWIAYWDKFSRPTQPKPRYARGIPETWWYDAQKAAKLEQRG